VIKSTRCVDRKAAEAVMRGWERAAVLPHEAVATRSTLSDASERFLFDRTNKGRAAGTLDSYRIKIAHLCRLLGGSTKLSRIDAKAVDNYVDARLREGVARHTIQKSLSRYGARSRSPSVAASFGGTLVRSCPKDSLRPISRADVSYPAMKRSCCSHS
jgi:hypothetical protein